MRARDASLSLYRLKRFTAALPPAVRARFWARRDLAIEKMRERCVVPITLPKLKCLEEAA